MRRFRRRDLLFAGAAACCISEASNAHGQGAKDSPVSGRISGMHVDASRVLCYLKGEGGKGELGKVVGNEFAFDRVPPGDGLLLKLTYNGHSYLYPVLNRDQKSRLEIKLPDFADVVSYPDEAFKKMTIGVFLKMFGVDTVNGLRAGLVRELSGIAGLTCDLKDDFELRGAYLGSRDGFQVTNRVLLAIDAAVRSVLDDAGDLEGKAPENAMLLNLNRSTKEWWQTLG